MVVCTRGRGSSPGRQTGCRLWNALGLWSWKPEGRLAVTQGRSVELALFVVFGVVSRNKSTSHGFRTARLPFPPLPSQIRANAQPTTSQQSGPNSRTVEDPC